MVWFWVLSSPHSLDNLIDSHLYAGDAYIYDFCLGFSSQSQTWVSSCLLHIPALIFQWLLLSPHSTSSLPTSVATGSCEHWSDSWNHCPPKRICLHSSARKDLCHGLAEVGYKDSALFLELGSSVLELPMGPDWSQHWLKPQPFLAHSRSSCWFCIILNILCMYLNLCSFCLNT